MRLAVISDIHGNLAALEAVLKDADQRGVEGFLHLGDLVGYGPRPNEVAALIKTRGIEGVAGNYDLASLCENPEEGMAKYLKKPISETARKTFLWTHERLNRETREMLAALPAQIWVEEGEAKYLFVHGSPVAPNEYLYPDTPLERLSELLDGTGAEVIFAGHTHLPMAVRVGDKAVINPGSVGRPKDNDPRASYIIADTESGFRVERIRVTFDVESVAIDCVTSGLPKEQAEGLRLGKP